MHLHPDNPEAGDGLIAPKLHLRSTESTRKEMTKPIIAGIFGHFLESLAGETNRLCMRTRLNHHASYNVWARANWRSSLPLSFVAGLLQGTTDEPTGNGGGGGNCDLVRLQRLASLRAAVCVHTDSSPVTNRSSTVELTDWGDARSTRNSERVEGRRVEGREIAPSTPSWEVRLEELSNGCWNGGGVGAGVDTWARRRLQWLRRNQDVLRHINKVHD